MNLYHIILAALCVLSVILNTYLYYKLKKKLPRKTDLMKQDINILHDLISDRARVLIEIKRIAPSEYFIRSPKDI